MMRTEPLTISFPGGRLERDETPLAAALREAEEEIGLPSSMIEVLGTLDVVDRRRGNERILPVVGWLDAGFVPDPNPTEVDAVIQVPLSSLLEVGAAWSEEWGEGSDARTIRFFAHPQVLGADLVWGLTARVIWELIERACVAAVTD
jgi:8-oxo-dGTP pyrophosphatase MutT (NUDIX family)